MNKEIKEKEETTGTNIAFINKEGEPIPYSAFVEFETLPKSVYGKTKGIGQVDKFQDGELAFFDFLRAFECHKLRYTEGTAVNLGSVKRIYQLDLKKLLPVIDWIYRLHNQF